MIESHYKLGQFGLLALVSGNFHLNVQVKAIRIVFFGNSAIFGCGLSCTNRGFTAGFSRGLIFLYVSHFFTFSLSLLVISFLLITAGAKLSSFFS